MRSNRFYSNYVLVGDVTTPELALQSAMLLALGFSISRWRWARCGIPGEREIAQTIRDLRDCDPRCAASGGLAVEWIDGRAMLKADPKLIVLRDLVEAKEKAGEGSGG